MTDIFWDLKSFFPGDAEFQLDNFHKLPYEYVYIAHRKAGKLRLRQLNDYEKPIAALTCMTANVNKDSKTKAFSPSDFFFYRPETDTDGPDGKCGASYLYLIENKMMPPWALFCFKEVSSAAGATAPCTPAAC